ncbi:MAG TPA: hypothetical protein VGL38_07240 [bacterium]|jgi:hypothetical protein
MRFSEFRLLRFLLRVAVFALLALVVGELFFRTVVPAGNTAFRVHDPEFGILIYDTTSMREGFFTAGRFAQQKAVWHVNNYGWRSAWNYLPPSPSRKPVIALIGDSYIAGFHVSEQDHIASVLQNGLKDSYDVYTFGEGGAPLSEFVWIARYAAKHFDPDVYVIEVGDGDWRSSITNYRHDPRVHQVTFRDGQFVDAPFSYDDRPRGRLPKYSALIRYLTFNADLQIFDALKRTRPKPPQAEQQKKASQEELMQVIEQEAVFFVQRIASEHPGKQIVFMVDGQRDSIYAGSSAISQASVARLQRVCADYSTVHVLDLAPAQAARFAADHRRFEFPFDDHWNEHGHQVIGQALADFLQREHILKP